VSQGPAGQPPIPGPVESSLHIPIREWYGVRILITRRLPHAMATIERMGVSVLPWVSSDPTPTYV